jgi:putative tricarboxylic transport membrane protein
MLLALNLPLIGIWVKILKIPYKTLFPLILLFCLIGSYSVGANIFDIYVMLIFGALGYLFRKLNYEPAPLVLAFVLGPMLEQNLRQALIISDGRFIVFLTHPLSGISLIFSLLLLFSAVFPSLQKRRGKVTSEK